MQKSFRHPNTINTFFCKTEYFKNRFSLALSPIEICSTQTFVTLGIVVSESSRIRQTNYQLTNYVYICLLPSEISLQLKILPKNIYKNKCREDEIDTIFNSPCLFTSNALIQFKSPMLVYEEYFNAGVSIYISHITIFTFATSDEKEAS